MANNIDLTICALECPPGTFQCSGRLFFRKEYTILFSPKRTTSRFASLTLRTPHRPIVSLCFSPKRSCPRFASLTLCLRTVLSFLCAFPVGLFSVSAPNRLFKLLRCSAWLILRRSPTGTSAPKRSCSRFASLTLRTAHRSPVSLCFSPKRTTSRFASLTLRLRTETFFQKVPVFRMAYSAIPHHRPYGRWCFARLIRQAETLELQPHSRPPSKRTALSPLKRSCFSRFAHPPNPAPSSRLFSISRRSGLMAPLCKGSCPASSRTEGLPPG